jgi:hypothetical protein
MARSDQILEGYLERVSGTIMDEYRDLLRSMIRRRSGVYALYKGERLYYVGLATNLMGRINGHLRDRHKGRWSRFSVYLTARSDQPHVRELEALLLRIAVPNGNRVSGRIGHAQNLSRSLAAEMAKRDAERRDQLLGGLKAKRKRRKQLRTGKGATALQGIAGRRRPLRAEHRGYVYRASLLADGQVRYGNRLFNSPSAAATAAVGSPMRGWWIWKFRKGGEWVRLRELRRKS